MKNKNTIGPSIHKVEPFFISQFYQNSNKSILYIGKDEREISSMEKKIKWLLPDTEILLFKSWDQIPYDNVSPTKEVQIERLKTLKILSNSNSKRIILTTINSITQKIIPKSIINSQLFKISKKQKFKFEDLINNFTSLGFQRTSLVRDKSEFSVRGSILDIFPNDRNKPIRIDFFDEEIENIFEFDPITQKRLKKINSDLEFNIVNELILNENNLNLFRKNFRTIFAEYRNSQFYNLFSEKIIPSGGEQFMPLFYEHLETLFDYIEQYIILLNDDFKVLLENRIENINDYYLARKNNKESFFLPPSYFYLSHENLKKYLDNNEHFYFNTFEKNNHINIEVNIIHNLSSIKKEIDFSFINQFFTTNSIDNKIYICCRSKGSLDRVSRILENNLNLKIKDVTNFNHSISDNIILTILDIEESLKFNKFIFINEKSLFGYFFNTQISKSRKQTIFFEELNKLSIDSILVHSDYGLCKFNNIRKIELNDSVHECLELEFFDNQKLFLPVENLNYVSKYSDDSNGNIILDKLGASHWKKRKADAKKKIRDAAKKLISIASNRLQSQSYEINTKIPEYDKFVSTFPFVETDDQLNAIQDVIDDFSKMVPSDRLIVGDVAFGKTEVILRAIFLAAKSNLQSVVLVPTTILSRQHFINFKKRLSIFKINISEISRLVSSKDKKAIFEKCNAGKIDVLVGTHALLNNKLNFKKLGLVIYDEEQKLGTIQKEKFKEIAPKAHCISLSATPIPRTLSMSLSGIRDLSLILTAPFERMAVRTYVSPFDSLTITEAIKREIYGRKNGVYFVVPRKKDLPLIEKFLNENLPEVKYVITHGQLSPKLLESRVSKFYNQEVPLMLSTNIIENGLDLPHVNTIIVYRANIFSLAALYQLKGRVGRSSKRGYAYITYKENELKDNGKKRLSIINSSDHLGAGFNIASQDLDLRGGGSIIGEEQSGFIKDIGTELYHQMLEEEINFQKNKLNTDVSQNPIYQPLIKIPEEIFIPDEYINDVDLRLSIYKRISNIKNTKEIDSLKIELSDRFGKLPLQLRNLFKIVSIKILCLSLNIEKFEFSRKGILIGFYQNKPKNPEKILKLSLLKDNSFLLRPDQKLFYFFDGNIIHNRFEFSENIINLLK
ncbi:MAG: transcription-repair coupling factor [Pelagibacteraceae bacterium TMED237]|nr:MAG: transcription-repair coupling factor [Pelagibacteraceae bacterium TMED237]